MSRPLNLPNPFSSVPWPRAVGFHALGPYCEACWLPHLGPTTYLLARRLVVAPGPWSKAELAAAMGTAGTGKNGTLERSLARLASFGLARAEGGNLVLRHAWPRVPHHLLGRMPGWMQQAEERLAAA